MQNLGDHIGSVGSLRDSDRKIVVARGTREPVVGLARRILTTSGFEVDSADRSPTDGENHLCRRTSGLMIRGIGHHTCHHDGVHPLQPHRLRGCGRVVELVFLARVFIDVTDDQSIHREDQNGHVTPKLVTIKGRLVVNDVTEDLFAAERSVKSLANNLRVVAASLNIGAQRHART
jgi:hypothetical protein